MFFSVYYINFFVAEDGIIFYTPKRRMSDGSPYKPIYYHNVCRFNEKFIIFINVIVGVNKLIKNAMNTGTLLPLNFKLQYDFSKAHLSVIRPLVPSLFSSTDIIMLFIHTMPRIQLRFTIYYSLIYM